MGLLDSLFSSDGAGGGLLGNMEDPRQVGMMNMAMGLLAAGGPSTRPIGFGQAVAHAHAQAMQSMQQAKQLQQERALRDLQMRQATLGLQKTEADLAEQKGLDDAYREFNRKGASASSIPANMQAASASPLDNPAFPRQPMPDWMLKALPQGQVQAPAAQQPATGTNNYTRHLQFAQFLEGRGQGKEAAKYYDLADKFRPRIKEQKVLMQGGKPVTVNVYEDGRTETVPGFAPAEKLSFHNTGGQTVGVDPFTGSPIATMKNTQSPDSMAGNAVTMRGQNMTDARSRELAQIQRDQGKIPPGYRMSADGTRMEAIPGGPADIGKALPNPAVKELGAAGTSVENTRRLSGSFKNDFGGKTILGDMSNTVGRVFGDDTGQSQWWQDMDALQNQTRHELFGSALTKTELAAWEKTSITPRMEPKQIQSNLQRRQEIEARAASKLARAYVAAGYNKAQIGELLGNAAQYVDNPAPPVTPVGGGKGGVNHPPEIQNLLKKYGG
jgi:hypothetical protein